MTGSKIGHLPRTGYNWRIPLKNSMNTNVCSQYEKESGTHSFLYSLDLGSRGTGTVRLSCKDANFVAAEKPWADIPLFSGTGLWFGGVVTAPIVCACDAQCNFTIFGTGDEIDVIRSTYTIEGDIYKLTTESGAIYTSVIDADSGLPAVTVSVHRPSLEVYGAADTDVLLTLQVLTED